MPYDFSEEAEMTNKELSSDIKKLSPAEKKPAPKKTDLDLISGVIEKLEKEQDKEYSRENRKALNSLNDAVNHLTRKQNKKG